MSGVNAEVVARMKSELVDWSETVDASFAGHDYPAGKLLVPDPESISWFDAPQYRPYLPMWKDRWEFKSAIGRPEKVNANKTSK